MEKQLTENLEYNKELEKLSIDDILKIFQIKIDYSKDFNEKKELKSILDLIKVNNKKDDYYKSVINELYNQSGKAIGMIKELLEIIQQKDRIIESNVKYSHIQNMNYFELMYDCYELLNEKNGIKDSNDYLDIDSAYSEITIDSEYSEIESLFREPNFNLRYDYYIHFQNDFKNISESDKELILNIFDEDDSDISYKLELFESIITKETE